MSARRYVVARVNIDPPMSVAIDERTGYTSEAYSPRDAKALAEWLNERDAGYPPNPALVC